MNTESKLQIIEADFGNAYFRYIKY